MAALPDVIGRSRLTRDDVRLMEEQGLLKGRWELIAGELINKMGQNAPHASVIAFLTVWLVGLYGMKVRCQLPIEVAAGDQSLNEPEPDLVVLRESKPEYDRRQPRGDEVMLLIEVADSSSRIDLTTKALLYARAGVPEYWVVDISNRRVVTHRRPENERYAQIDVLSEEQALSFQGSSLPISDFLPRL